MKILLIEDEINVGVTLYERLTAAGYEVFWAKTGHEALNSFRKHAWDLLVMDVGLPDTTGFELAGTVRSIRRDTPILFLTAFGAPEDRVRGLELGAEDYVVKPFHLKELMLRIRNILKRVESLKTLADEIMIGGAKVHFSRFQIECADGRVIDLTHKECALLKLLIENRGKVLSRDEILDQVWSADEYPTPRTVDNFVVKIRKMIEKDPENPTYIRSVRGVGYQLTLQ